MNIIKQQLEYGDCYECLKDKKLYPDSPFFYPQQMMIVCVECGNKRCPKATDHKLACTHSNELNQIGSRYHENWQEGSLAIIDGKEANEN